MAFSLLASCERSGDDPDTAAFEVFCEQVANGAKPIALSLPVESRSLEAAWEQYLEIAAHYGVELYREDNFPDNWLFPGALSEGQSLAIIYSGERLTQYRQWKADMISAEPTDRAAQTSLARRLGRLLGYGPEGINRLLRKGTDFRDLASWGLESQTTHLYYPDLEAARTFYKAILGLRVMEQGQIQIGSDTFLQLHPHDADHPSGQAPSVAVALLTDQLPGWYAHLQAANVPIKYPYRKRDGGPHDGFVAVDPGGYLLEFEQFKQHPENERLIAVLEGLPHHATRVDSLQFYGTITWTYHKDLLKMQRFYEEVLGCSLVADQGWTKIYQTSTSGFIGLVDERRGMRDYADSKGVELEWGLSDTVGLKAYGQKHWGAYQFDEMRLRGPEAYLYRLSVQ